MRNFNKISKWEKVGSAGEVASNLPGGGAYAKFIKLFLKSSGGTNIDFGVVQSRTITTGIEATVSTYSYGVLHESRHNGDGDWSPWVEVQGTRSNEIEIGVSDPYPVSENPSYTETRACRIAIGQGCLN